VPKFIVVTTVIERREIEAATPDEAFELNNNAEGNDYSLSVEVPDRYATDGSGRQFREAL